VKSRTLLLLAVATLAVLGLALGYLLRESRTANRPTVNPTPLAGAKPVPDLTAGSVAPPVSDPAQAASGSLLAASLDRLLAQSGTVTDADLAALKNALLAGDPRRGIADIREFLRTGRDAKTSQEFTLAPGGGGLSGAPTLRLMLLDVLGQLARKIRSDAAAQVGRDILESKDSPDEWALALRNVAWAEPQSRGYLAGKMREMLSYEPWRSAPSDGMLEALDVIVFTRDASLIPDLADARPTNRELGHAVDIALDRLAEAAPLDVLTYLNTHPAILNERPMVRADYFAKADLSQPAQRVQVEIYLGRPDISLGEKDKLLRALTTPASFVSDTLLTEPTPADDGSGRRATLAQTTRDWLAGDRFPTLRAPLLEIQDRLSR
jgi:hypothetical protein